MLLVAGIWRTCDVFPSLVFYVIVQPRKCHLQLTSVIPMKAPMLEFVPPKKDVSNRQLVMEMQVLPIGSGWRMIVVYLQPDLKIFKRNWLEHMEVDVLCSSKFQICM